MLKKILIIAIVVSIPISIGLFYFFTQHNSKDNVEVVIDNKIFISWQKITIKEKAKDISINIALPRVIIPDDNNSETMVNKKIEQNIELLKNDFIFTVSTAAEDNGETNTFNINTEILLANPRLISLAFTITTHIAGTKDDDPKRTFLIFDLINNTLVEGNELFRDNVAYAKAIEIMKTSLPTNYQEIPGCDLLFAPKYNGFAVSYVGIDWNRGGEHLSITRDIPISLIQEFLAPSVLSDIIK
ncbi:hypothetical protein L6252_01995 [Candidatus Parcubacteria bacterium]|nr:hypothetical protein [Candidatus Parcubacteria bacterium]